MQTSSVGQTSKAFCWRCSDTDVGQERNRCASSSRNPGAALRSYAVAGFFFKFLPPVLIPRTCAGGFFISNPARPVRLEHSLAGRHGSATTSRHRPTMQQDGASAAKHNRPLGSVDSANRRESQGGRMAQAGQLSSLLPGASLDTLRQPLRQLMQGAARTRRSAHGRLYEGDGQPLIVFPMQGCGPESTNALRRCLEDSGLRPTTGAMVSTPGPDTWA